jgi:SAM-dependent methyltransferase
MPKEATKSIFETTKGAPAGTVIEGIPCYAPELAFENGNFSAHSYELLYQTEAKNFWFRARGRIVLWAVSRFLAPAATAPKEFLELGCGTGYVLGELSRLPGLRRFGADLLLEGLKFARKRMPDVQFAQVDATRMPYERAFDGIGAFDILEHIQEDRLALKEIGRALKPGGVLFLTVPQHAFLWSAVDVLSFHKRRYSRHDLQQKLTEAGYELLFQSSFVTAAFPLLLVRRLLNRQSPSVGAKPSDLSEKAKESVYAEVALPTLLNFVLSGLMAIDTWLLRRGIRLPFGGSLLMVARKNPQ